MTARSARDQPRALPDAQPILDGFWKCAQARRCSWARGCPGGRLALQGSMCIHAAPRVCGSDARLARASRTHHLRVPASACLQEPLGFKRALHLVGVIVEVAKVGIIHHGLRGPRRGASRAAGSAPPTSGKLYARRKTWFCVCTSFHKHTLQLSCRLTRVCSCLLSPSLARRFAQPPGFKRPCARWLRRRCGEQPRQRATLLARILEFAARTRPSIRCACRRSSD